MKIIRKILIVTAFLLAAVFIAAAAYLQINGKELIVTTLSRALNRSVAVQDVRFQPPLGLKLDAVDVEGLLTAQELTAQFNPLGLLKGRIDFFVIALHGPKIKPIPLVDNEKTASEPVAQKEPAQLNRKAKPGRRPVYVEKLEITGGMVEFLYRASEKNVPISLTDVNCVVEDLALPLASVKTLFQLDAKLPKGAIPGVSGTVNANGWVNLIKKDMNANLTVTDQGMPNSLTAELEALNNDVNVKGRVNLNSEAFRLLQGGQAAEQDVSSVQNVIVNVLGQAGLDMGLDFSFKTKMDHFEITNISFSGSVTSKSVAR